MFEEFDWQSVSARVESQLHCIQLGEFLPSVVTSNLRSVEISETLPEKGSFYFVSPSIPSVQDACLRISIRSVADCRALGWGEIEAEDVFGGDMVLKLAAMLPSTHVAVLLCRGIG